MRDVRTVAYLRGEEGDFQVPGPAADGRRADGLAVRQQLRQRIHGRPQLPAGQGTGTASSVALLVTPTVGWKTFHDASQALLSRWQSHHATAGLPRR